jgi:hypothetical protein
MFETRAMGVGQAEKKTVQGLPYGNARLEEYSRVLGMASHES